MAQEQSPDCLFCKMVQGVIQPQVVMDTDNILAFHDIDPKAPTHILVIPKTHVTSMADVQSVELAGAVMLAAAQVAKDAGLETSGYRLVTNIGVDGGQSVFHLHVHVLGGRPLSWPPG